MTQQNQDTCQVFDIIHKDIIDLKNLINDGDIASISNFATLLQHWYRAHTEIVTQCSNTKTVPSIESYSRNKIAWMDNEYIIFVHRLKHHSATPYHNHGETKGTVFILPITDGVSEDSFLHNITDFSTNSPVYLYPAETHTLHKGEVYIGSNNLVHKVYNPTDDIQTFVEIYLPIPQGMKIYMPFYGEKNKFLPLDPICTNIPYHKALASSVEAKEGFTCKDLLHDTTGNSTIFTATGTVIQHNTSLLEHYYAAEGCKEVAKISDDIFVLFSPEIGQTNSDTEVL